MIESVCSSAAPGPFSLFVTAGGSYLSPAPTGWTCGLCRTFVPDGCVHHCPTSVFPIQTWPPQAEPQVTVQPDPFFAEALRTMQLQAIVDLLGRIADALEKAQP